jgi:hypothetical protein
VQCGDHAAAARWRLHLRLTISKDSTGHDPCESLRVVEAMNLRCASTSAESYKLFDSFRWMVVILLTSGSI